MMNGNFSEKFAEFHPNPFIFVNFIRIFAKALLVTPTAILLLCNIFCDSYDFVKIKNNKRKKNVGGV